MTTDRARQILEFARKKRILVIGDVMLDEFVWGRVRRISPEAPVPAVEVTGESFYPGGAANVARNLRKFVDRVAVIAMISAHRNGQQLRELQAEQKIHISNSIADQTFRTIGQPRILA